MTHIVLVGMGSVGVSTAGSILSQGLASQVTFFDIVDDKAQGESLDFQHAAALLPACTIEAKPYESLFGGDICIVSAGVKGRPSETRLDLLERNIRVVDDICEKFERNGFPRMLIVLTNPVDVITEYFTRRLAQSNVIVFGSGTSLDSYRLRQVIATRAMVHPANVHAWVVGEHGDSSVPLFSSANIGCVPLLSFQGPHRAIFQTGDFAQMSLEVRNAAANIIRCKGAIAHAIGIATGRILRAVIRNEGLLSPVSIRVDGNTCLSVPCQINSQGAKRIADIQMSASESIAFDASLSIVKKACLLLPPVASSAVSLP